MHSSKIARTSFSKEETFSLSDSTLVATQRAVHRLKSQLKQRSKDFAGLARKRSLKTSISGVLGKLYNRTENQDDSSARSWYTEARAYAPLLTSDVISTVGGRPKLKLQMQSCFGIATGSRDVSNESAACQRIQITSDDLPPRDTSCRLQAKLCIFVVAIATAIHTLQLPPKQVIPRSATVHFSGVRSRRTITCYTQGGIVSRPDEESTH